MLLSAVAAAGLMAVPAAAQDLDAGQHGTIAAKLVAAVNGAVQRSASDADDASRLALAGETREAVDDSDSRPSSNAHRDPSHSSDANGAETGNAPAAAPAELLQGTESAAHGDLAASTLVADGVAMPSAEMLLGAGNAGGGQSAGEAHSTTEVSRVLADALGGGVGGDANDIDALLSGLPGQPGGPQLAELAAGHAGSGGSAWDMNALAGYTAEHPLFDMAALALHQDAVPVA